MASSMIGRLVALAAVSTLTLVVRVDRASASLLRASIGAHGRMVVADELLQSADAAMHGPEQDLMNAVKKGDDQEWLSRALAAADINCEDKDGNTPLMVAIATSRRDETLVVKTLLGFEKKEGVDKVKVNVDAKNGDGHSALMLAAKQLREDFVHLLLGAHADMDLQSNDGSTALMLAIQGRDTGIVKALLTAGAGRDLKNSLGVTALMLAAESRYDDIVKELLSNKVGAPARADLQDNEGRTALHLAAAMDSKSILEALLAVAAGIIDVKDKEGNTALMLAARDGHTDAATALIGAGADKSAANLEGKTAVMIAHSSEMVNLLQA